jgi:hypothetical protein
MTLPHVALPLKAAGRAVRFVVRVTLGEPERHGERDQAEHVRDAWLELKEHPALTWVPPLWRPDEPTPAALEAARRHRVSALQQNLRVDVVPSTGGLRVRLATGPLTDRKTASGVDPLRPAAVGADLVVEGSTFEDAVLALRDAVRTRYPASETAARCVAAETADRCRAGETADR